MNEFKKVIKAYLDNRAKTDALFAQSYAKPNKSIDECLSYIMGEARKKGNAVCVSDEVVFGWAVHYYDEDDIKVGKIPAGTKVKTASTTNPFKELTEKEKQQLKNKAAEEYKQQCIANMRAADEAKAKKDAEKRKAQLQRKREQEMSMPSLFQF